MKRSAPLLIALLLTAFLAGCNDPAPAEATVPAEAGEEAAAGTVANETVVVPMLPEDLEVPGATLVSNDGTTAVFTYDATAPAQTGIWVQFVGAVQTTDVIDTLDLPVPAGLLLQVNLSLAWDSQMDMDLYLYDASGTELCAAEHGQGAMNPVFDAAVGMESVEACGHVMESPLVGPDLWSVDMEVFHNDQSGEPYRLTITYRLP